MKEGRVGLLAGRGELPLEFLKEASNKGVSVITFALEGITSKEVESLSFQTYWIKPFKLGTFFKKLKESKVDKLFFLGKIEHSNALSLRMLDLKAATFLLKLPDRKPETIIKGIIKEVESIGIEVPSPVPYLSGLLLPKGSFLGRKLPKELLKDAQFGIDVAKKVASLDIGQTVVVKSGAVVAVEAIEGTDECIKRGAQLAGGQDFIVCKAGREKQDMRIDVPTVGLNTVKLIHSLGGRVLIVEAGKTFVLNKREIENFCKEKGFSLLAL